MSHYVCYGGCKGVSSEPGTCQDPNCPEHGQALHKCDCTDGMSHQFVEKAGEEQMRDE